MSDYELVWSVEVRRKMPIGVVLLGEKVSRGVGATPDEALEDLRRDVNRQESALAEKAALVTARVES